MRTIDELKSSAHKLLVVHYACGDFLEEKTIIDSISVKDYSSGQIESFSFDRYTGSIEEREAALLKGFVKYMADRPNYLIVGWNLKSSTFGMQHIKKRWEALGIIDPFPINPRDVVDLDDTFGEEYGRGYAARDPKLLHLAKLNAVPTIDYVPGLEEITLFKEGKYKRIEVSTNRKVSMIADFLDLAFKNKMKTDRPDAVFIVHGHDLEARDKLDVHLRGLGLSTIILEQKPNDGLTLIEKFEQNSARATAAIRHTYA